MNTRIAIVRPDPTPTPKGFYNSQEIGLARGLSMYSVDTDIYIAGTSNEIIITEIDSPGNGVVRLIETPHFTFSEVGISVYPKIFKLIRTNDYDFIQLNESNDFNNYLLTKLAAKLHIPVVIYQGMYESLPSRILQLIEWIFDRSCLYAIKNKTCFAVCKTSSAEKHLISKGFKNTTIIPVGIDVTAFSDRQDRDWRKEYDIPVDHKILLYIGKVEQRRNVDFLLDIAGSLKKSAKPYTLVIAGDGPNYSEVQDRVISQKLNNVRLLGKVSQREIPSLYENSHFFLLASDYEIYGMVVLEAMYFGVPVLSTMTAGPVDIIKSGEDGFLLERLRCSDWVGAIDKGSDPLLHESMSRKARAKIIENLTWEAVAKNYLKNVITKCIKNKKSSD